MPTLKCIYESFIVIWIFNILLGNVKLNDCSFKLFTCGTIRIPPFLLHDSNRKSANVLLEGDKTILLKCNMLILGHEVTLG